MKPNLLLSRLGLQRPDGSRPFAARLLALLLLPLLVTGGIPAGAQVPLADPSAQPSPLAGRTIESIEFRGLQALTEDTILFYLGLQPGQTMDEAQLNRNVKELWNRSLVDDVEVEAVPAGADAVKLIITVQERPVLRSIDYQGLKRISKTDIQDKLSTQRIRVRHSATSMTMASAIISPVM